LASLALGKAMGRLTGILPHVRSTLAKAAK
jgi:hypothetical protein